MKPLLPSISISFPFILAIIKVEILNNKFQAPNKYQIISFKFKTFIALYLFVICNLVFII